MTHILQKLRNEVHKRLVMTCTSSNPAGFGYVLEPIDAAIREQEQQAKKRPSLQELEVILSEGRPMKVEVQPSGEIRATPDFRVQPAPDHNCLTCLFFHGDRNTEFSRLGQCRFNPPDVREDKSSNGPIWNYRTVYYTNPCGRYEVRK